MPPGGERPAESSVMAEVKPGDVLLVTGASGFVGSAIANAARAAGYRVRVLVRASSPRTNIAPTDEVMVGDICDRASLAAALRGARYLAHAAADYRLWSRDPDEIIRTNVDGTRAVMEEALRAGVERIVYTSSVATLEPRDDRPADETDPLPESRAIGAYKTSKVIAELQHRGHIVEVGGDWSEGRLTAASRDGRRRRAAANPRGMQAYAAGR